MNRLSVPLTKGQIKAAIKLNIFVLAHELVVQHETQGGVVVPAGRAIMLIGKDKPKIKEEYVATSNILVLKPGVANLDGNAPPHDTIVIPKSKASRLVVLPINKELEYVRLAAQSASFDSPVLS